MLILIAKTKKRPPKNIKSKIISIGDNSVSIIINHVYDGTIPLNELTWLKKPPHPSKIVNINQETDVKIIEIDNEEVPILDGSAAPFVKQILEVGLKTISSSSRIIRITRPVIFENQSGWASLTPFDRPEMEYFIDFDDCVIGKQSKILNMSNGSFVKELCSSRTFCSNKDVETMRENGLALGGNFTNAVVVDGDKVLSPGGMRYQDEAVRHKMLDAFGDLALAGAPILGKYEGHKAGHFITNSLLRKLFSKPDSYTVENCSEEVFNVLPGSGVDLAEFTAVA